MDCADSAAVRPGVIMLYLCGSSSLDTADSWYQLVLRRTRMRVDANKQINHRHRKKIMPIAKLCHRTYGKAGSWTIVENRCIYWIGGCINMSTENRVFSRLLKHNIYEGSADLRVWEPCSPPMDIPRGSPFVAVIRKKLYAIAGEEHFIGLGYNSGDEWSNCGQAYSIDNGNWEYLETDINNFLGFNTTLAEFSHFEEPKEILLYSFQDISTALMRCWDVCRRVLGNDVALRQFSDGLDLLSEAQHDALTNAITYSEAVVRDKRFYWFTGDLQLHVFDSVQFVWFRSENLQNVLPRRLKTDKIVHLPILVGLPDNSFVVVFTENPGNLSVAILEVDLNVDPIRVLVVSCQAYRFDDQFFRVRDAKGMLKQQYKGPSLPMDASCSECVPPVVAAVSSGRTASSASSDAVKYSHFEEVLSAEVDPFGGLQTV